LFIFCRQVKSEYVHHKAISGAIGVKLCATGIEKAVAGTPIMVVGSAREPTTQLFIVREI